MAKTPEEAVPELLERALKGPVACVFGRESAGLSNEELKLCTHHMIVPTDKEFASMNVSHACGVVAAEIFKRACRPVGFQVRGFKPASLEEREAMFRHIQDVLIRAGFLPESDPLRMMRGHSENSQQRSNGRSGRSNHPRDLQENGKHDQDRGRAY